MKKPKVVMLSYFEHIRDLDPYVDLHYYNCNMPESRFHELAKGADLIIEQEFNDGKAKYGGLLQMVPNKKAVWLIDSHTRPDHPDYAKNFDHVFVAINHKRNIFSMPTTHMPLACTFASNAVGIYEGKKEYDVVFVGQFLVKGGRKDLLRRLSDDLNTKKISHKFTRAYGQAYIDIHQRGKIGFNKSIGNELNFRVFEAMAMGIPQVTDLNDELMLVNGLHERIFGYKEYEEIHAQIDKLLTIDQKILNNDMKEKQKWLTSKHMITHRHISIIEQCLGYDLQKIE